MLLIRITKAFRKVTDKAFTDMVVAAAAAPEDIHTAATQASTALILITKTISIKVVVTTRGRLRQAIT